MEKEKNKKFCDTISALRDQRDLKMKDVANGIGINPTTYRKYENGGLEPSFSTLEKLADFYGVTTDYLLGRPDAKPPKDTVDLLASEKRFSELEEELLRKYMELPHEARQAVVQFLNDATAKAMQRKAESKRQHFITKKRSLHKVSAGSGYDLEDIDAWEDVEVLDTPESRRADFLLKIDGDSMEDTFHDGETICVQQTPSVDVGDIGVFMVDGCGYVKELGNGCLISHNSAYPPIQLKGTESRCFGRVLGTAEVVHT